MEASCQFYIAGDTLGFSTFGSFGLHLFWLVGRRSRIDLGGSRGNETPCRHRLFQIHSRISFQSVALDAERPSVAGFCNRAHERGDIVVAAAERLNQRTPIAALPVRSVDCDAVQAWHGFLQ